METWGLDGPYFEDLHVGQRLEPAPSITIDSGTCALYQAICGDPLPVSLSAPLAARVTGSRGAVVNPALVLHVAIGQSTVATRRVIANLFYRGVVCRQLVLVGETLSTTVEIKGLREAARRPDRPARGLALLGIRTSTDGGEVVADFERCAMLPLRTGAGPTGHDDDLGPATAVLDLGSYARHAPQGWDLGALGGAESGWSVGETRADPLHDTVTDALALVRLTQNLAGAHRDARLGQRGRRLVYGGHTIGLAQASLGRMLPSIATVVGWHSCDHTGPVFEGDVLAVRATLDAVHELPAGRLLAFTVLVEAGGADRPEPAAVLDWKPVVLAP
jgi:2-methylfumaryl-CoA hydratase